MFAMASFSVAPCDQQPGRPGTDTLTPSALRVSAILYFMVAPSDLQDTEVLVDSLTNTVVLQRHAVRQPYKCPNAVCTSAALRNMLTEP